MVKFIRSSNEDNGSCGQVKNRPINIDHVITIDKDDMDGYGQKDHKIVFQFIDKFSLNWNYGINKSLRDADFDAILNSFSITLSSKDT